MNPHCRYCGTRVMWDEARDGFAAGWYSFQHYTNICPSNSNATSHNSSSHDVA